MKCEVVAPTLVPVKAGDRVKTDRRDAMKLARSYRAGDLTAVWVPNQEHEALRDLVRAREAAKQDQLRARHRLSKFLLPFVSRALGSGAAHRVGLDHYNSSFRSGCWADFLGDPASLSRRLESCCYFARCWTNLAGA